MIEMENHSPKITYLFGAGASAQKLPTIKELPDRIKKAKEFIQAKYNFEADDQFIVRNYTINKNEAKNYILEGLDNLCQASFNHSTIDTYAKKLYINGRTQEVKELIFFLALFFNIEQKIVGTDPRYYTFLISILDSSAHSFPDNLKFLSWNYDLQLEMSYSDLTDTNIDELDFGQFNRGERYWEKDKFTSIKINGSCTSKGRFDDAYSLIKNIRNPIPSNDDIDFILQFGCINVRQRVRIFDTQINIDFAWYKDLETLSKICELHSETQILTVIGYSFPFFNREVDRKIIRSMEKLQKIYIQDKFPDNIATRFLSILPDYKKKGIEIIPINTIDEFFLPPEL